jgi:hypothetical protein
LSDSRAGASLMGAGPTLGHSHVSEIASITPPLKAQTMTFKTNLICAAALIAFGAFNAQAQTTRAAVKAEAATDAASKPMGEMSVPNQDKGSKPMASNTTREAVKADTQAARAAGTIPQGEQSTPRQGKKPPMRTSEKSRAEVKAEAVQANKEGAGLSRGEQSVPGQDKGGVAKP